MLFSRIYGTVMGQLSCGSGNEEGSSSNNGDEGSSGGGIVGINNEITGINFNVTDNQLLSGNLVGLLNFNPNISVGDVHCFGRGTYITGKEKSNEEDKLQLGESLVLQSSSLISMLEKEDLVIPNNNTLFSCFCCCRSNKISMSIEEIFESRKRTLKNALLKAANKVQTLCAIQNLFCEEDAIVDLEKLMNYRSSSFSEPEKYKNIEVLCHSTLILLSAISKKTIKEEKIITEESRLNCLLFSFGFLLNRNNQASMKSILLSELEVLYSDRFDKLKYLVKFAPCSGRVFCIDMSPELKTLFGIS